MGSQLFPTADDQNEPPSSAFRWWRTAEEFNQNGGGGMKDEEGGFTPRRTRVLREMERLALVAPEGLDDLRHKLISYRSGDFWLPTGGIKKEDMEIPPVITILLVGLSGSGKSALVNLMYSVLGRSGLIPFAQTSNENPFLVLTHGDLLSCEERIDARLKICEYLGVFETTGAYDIACITEQGILPEASDPVTAFALTEVVYRALLQSDRAHLPKRKLKDWVWLCVSWIMCSIAAFFAMLAHVFSKLGRKNKA